MNTTSSSLRLRNHQRSPVVNLHLLRSLVCTFVVDILKRPKFDLDIHLVGAELITQLNEKFLQHKGPTDVISFNYSAPTEVRLEGEVFVCTQEAMAQARRFGVSWQHELVRYIVHGILHLCGYDDRTAAQRAKMKREENSALRQLARQLRFSKLGRRPRQSS